MGVVDGVSCVVASGVDTLTVTAGWGRYGKAEVLDDAGNARVAELPAALHETARTAIFTARRCADRIRAGIELVSSPAAAGHQTALAAFRFANEAMALQRRHTTIAAIREADGLGYAEAAEAVREKGAEVASWRPFQLAAERSVQPAWRRASFCASGECIEVAQRDSLIMLRDSTQPRDGTVHCAAEQ